MEKLPEMNEKYCTYCFECKTNDKINKISMTPMASSLQNRSFH